LLEAVVYSHRAAGRLAAELADAESAQARSIPPETVGAIALATTRSIAKPEDLAGTHGRDALRRLMWNDVGIVRSTARMREAAVMLRDLRARAAATARDALNLETIEFLNLVHTAMLIVACAERRRESRGLHYTIDYPFRNNERFLRDTIVAGQDLEEA
jgi:L-aspartate oxidase